MTWHDYVAESDRMAYEAKRYANATREAQNSLTELYSRHEKTDRDWLEVSQLIVTVNNGLKTADIFAQLSSRAATLAELTERTERR